jgi:uncharacterized membrane protein
MLSKSTAYARICALAAVLCVGLSGCGDSGAPAAGASGQPGVEQAAATNLPPGPSDQGPGQEGQPPPAANVDTGSWKLQPPFYAAGDEPAWELKLDDGYFVFSRGAGIPEVDARFVAPTSQGGADVFETGPFKLTIQPGACEVRGQTGQANVTIVLANITYDGCAFAGSGGSAVRTATSDETDLLEDIPDAIGAIDSCLAKLAEPAVVSGIFPRGDTAVGVALRARNNALYECEASSSHGPAVSVDEVEASSAGPWLRSTARFLRAGQGNAGSCQGTKPVVVGGQTLGVLVPRNCRF